MAYSVKRTERKRVRKKRSFFKKNRRNFEICAIVLPVCIVAGLIISYFFSDSHIEKNFYASSFGSKENEAGSTKKLFYSKEGDSKGKETDDFIGLATRLFKIKLDEVQKSQKK